MTGISMWKAAIEPLSTQFDMRASRTAAFVEGMNVKVKKIVGQNVSCKSPSSKKKQLKTLTLSSNMANPLQRN